MPNKNQQWLKWAKQLQAVAQAGLAYSNNVYDIERFRAIQEISAEIFAQHTDLQHETILNLFAAESGYPTPKVDVRGVVFKDDKILLVRERQDDRWALPGGWADIDNSPSESVEREILEESGYIAKAVKLLALYDANKQEHQAQWPHLYKCIFLCELMGGEAKTSYETTAVQFFSKDELPPLSLFRVTASQILRFFEHRDNPEWPTDFD